MVNSALTQKMKMDLLADILVHAMQSRNGMMSLDESLEFLITDQGIAIGEMDCPKFLAESFQQNNLHQPDLAQKVDHQ